MATAKRLRLLLGVLVLVAVGGGVYFTTGGPASPLEQSFRKLRVGMTTTEVEAILGPGRGPDPTADRVIVAGFDDVDAAPLALGLSPPSYWYDGHRCRVRVHFRQGKLWGAKLNRPGQPGRQIE